MATITRIDLANTLRNRFGLTSADSYKMIDIIHESEKERRLQKKMTNKTLELLKFYLNLHALVAIQKQVYLLLYQHVVLQVFTQAQNLEKLSQINKKNNRQNGGYFFTINLHAFQVLYTFYHLVLY